MSAPASTNTLDSATIQAFESLNKWKMPANSEEDIPPPDPRMVYEHNRSKAASKGFPSVLEVGNQRGLSSHETTALYGWTTGDYRLLNPIARAQDVVQFEDYPYLPQKFTKVTFRLTKEEVQPYIEVFNSALSKLPSDGQVVWRGHKRQLPKEIGSTFCLEGFASATLDRDTALEFCVKTDGNKITKENLKRTLICVLSSTRGKSISKFSARPEELEIIFLRDTKFQVVEPPESQSNDQEAVRKALKDLQDMEPDATIELVYVTEAEGWLLN